MKNQKNLKTLRQFWYRKLERQGFRDIEYPNGLLRKPTRIRAKDLEDFELTRVYFSRLADHIESERFNSDEAYLTMLLASEGVCIQDIAQVVGINRRTVRFIIRRFEKKWGLIDWTPRQMALKDIK